MHGARGISMNEYILSIDQGTTSSRCMLFDRNGTALTMAQYGFAQHYPNPGWVEQDPMYILGSVLHSMGEAFSKSELSATDIAAIGITNQRETTIVWDKRTGLPVYPAIVWQCRRTAPLCDAIKMEGLSGLIQDRTGLVVDAYFSATKIKWILDHIPGVNERALAGDLLFGTVDTWLIWNLTGGISHVTDYSNASRTMLFDIEKLAWDDELLRLLGIPRSMLPEVLPTCTNFGKIAKGIKGIEKLEGIPILAVAGDQSAALFGQTCFSEGDTKNTYGTGCFTLMNTGSRRVRSENGLVSSVAWSINGNLSYALEGSVFSAGAAISWLKEGLGIISTPRECDELAETLTDNDGVYLVPAFTGLGAPYWDMYARGSIIGLTRGTGRAHIARAALESIAYQVRDLVELMQTESTHSIRELRVDGGASVSDFLMQFQADILGIPVNRAGTVETTSLGVANLAGMTCGIWTSLEQLKALRKSAAIYTPHMEEVRRDRYYEQWKRAVLRSGKWIGSDQ